MVRKILGGVLGFAESAASLAGVPFVGGALSVLQEIVKVCDEVKIHKKKVRQIRGKCVQYINAIEDRSQRLDPELIQSIDEARAVFERVHGRMVRWSRLSAWSYVLKLSEISDGLEQCDTDLDSAIGILNLRTQRVINKTQEEMKDALAANHAEIKDILIQALTRKSETQQVIAMERTGSNVAYRLMQAGQEQLREELQIARCDSPAGPDAPRPWASRSGSIPGNGIREALFKFHTETGTLPAIKVLDAEITKMGELAVAGGTYSDIWLGLWLGRKKVALKSLRNIKADDPKAKARFEREVKTWSSLRHDHILPFYGLVTNLGKHIHMVSPWQEKGNVLEYLKKEPQADRFKLIKGAALGLAYLHSKNVVHGNVKCTNILVLDNGDSCICDFGMSKLIEEVTERTASATLTAAGSARWLAPELIIGSISSPTLATDVYSYAMAILELLTGRPPFAERKRDASVIHDVVNRKQTPVRPKDPAVCVWLPDDLWRLLQSCWHNSSDSRPSMEGVTANLELIK
ncbi:TKL/TKL-ccin protein kinase [Coprinopsis marcescibilis]|uniref:TKL/TKL-ccin protein kinase n=1 Tax=Coprinopsis marcescibilis TaxID=230819 RepID=A0A5C3KX22_COPMA|nr:TKL/TKL-ccin protein kinase [Coprinopsis marcescibilis]